MNNEQQELLYEVYGKALLELAFDWLPYTPPNPPLDTIESFINKCKTDSEFSEKWGLKIEERELSLEERQDLYFKLNPEFRLMHESMIEHMIKHKIPTKLITTTKITKIESYE
jgi:hypothetical protein